MTPQAIAHYRITAKLGEGGMGEVYRATDTKLGREVAIKIAAERFSDRFTREARAIAALNHSNLCHLYDVGPNYLVMEYVDGETLRGPVDAPEALPLIFQLIDGIEAAHERNVIHRDLKPANIKITAEGTVKILDFGLAKVADSEPQSNPESSPTVTLNATQAGVILGTAAYMSPEQARGKRADRRSDIWSFGAVAYELLTGKRAFEGESIGETLAAVIKSEPDWTPVPPRFQRLLRTCLEKDPKKRLQAIGDARLLLDEASAQVIDRSKSSYAPWIIAATVAIAAAAMGWMAYRGKRPAELKPLVNLEVDLGSDAYLLSRQGTDVLLSPDGTRLVYGSRGRLFTRRLDQPKALELPGTEGAASPFYSPDGRWIAFYGINKLKKISVEGGEPIALCDAAPNPRGGDWGEDGNIIASVRSNGPLSRIPSAGGEPTPVTELAPGELAHRWPQILPGGKAVLFTVHNSPNRWDEANIDVFTLADHRRKTVIRGGTYGRYLPSGHIVYVNKGSLFAVPFDLDSLALRGAPAPVLQGISYNSDSGWAQFSFSRDGTFVYRNGADSRGWSVTVQWLERTGKLLPLLAKAGGYNYPRLSPDGRRLAISTQDVWVYEWERDILTRLTFSGGANATDPLWTPDGRYIIFHGLDGLYSVRSDGAGKPQPLTQSKDGHYPSSFTPDGKRLVFHELTSTTATDLWTLPIEINASGVRAGKPELFLKTPFNERNAAFSPDGRWLAYASDESGMLEVYVRAFPDTGGKWQISSGGGLYPLFGRDGHSLFYRTPGNQIMAANYRTTGDSFLPDKPQVWAETRIADSGLSGKNYDVSPDGKRIAVLYPSDTPGDRQPQNEVTVLLNFFDELERRVPVNKK